MLGLVWDADASTNAWKAVCGDGGAVYSPLNWVADAGYKNHLTGKIAARSP